MGYLKKISVFFMVLLAAIFLVSGAATAVNATQYKISGSVVYENGSPAAGSLVVLKRNTDYGYVFSAGTIVSDTGTYTFNKPAGTYQIFVSSRDLDYCNGQSDSITVTDADVTVPQITLQASFRLTGSVTVNGSVLPGLQVKVMNGETVVGVYPVKSDGSFQTPPLPEADYTLYAVYGSYSILISAGQANELTMALYTISGKITEKDTETAVTNAMISLRDQEMGHWMNGKLSYSDSTGSYTIANIPSGTYTLNITQSFYHAYKEANLSIAADMTKNVQLVKGTWFNVTVRNGSNADALLAGVSVIVTREGDDPVYGMTDAKGNCKIRGLDGTKSDYSIMAQKHGYVRQTLTDQTPAADPGTSVNFTLNKPSAFFNLSGTITSGTAADSCGGSPVGGAHVLVSTETTGSFASATTNDQGQYSFTKLPPAADYRFVVMRDSAFQTYEETGLSFTGDTTKNVTIPCGSPISGTVTGSGGAQVSVFLYTADNKFVAFTKADAETGAYKFEGLTGTTTYKVLAVALGLIPKWYDNQSKIDTATPVSAGATGVNIVF